MIFFAKQLWGAFALLTIVLEKKEKKKKVLFYAQHFEMKI